MTARCSPAKISHSYFIVMEDRGKLGLEAIVHPEDTRRSIVAKIMSGEYEHIAFIHHVDDLLVEDVTMDLIEEAEAQLRAASFYHRADRIAATFDHVRDHRKNEAVS